LPDDGRPGQVMVCIETDRGPWSGRWPWLAIGCMQWIPGRPPGTGSCCLSGTKSDQADAFPRTARRM